MISVALSLAATSVLVLDLSTAAADDVSEASARLLTEVVSSEAAAIGMNTISAQDVRRVAQLTAEKTEAGCDTSSCLAELSSAMGVELVIFGDVGKLGDTYLITLRLFDSNRAEAVARETAEAATLDALRTGVGPAVRRLLEGGGVVRVSGPEPALLWTGAGVAAVGGAALVGFGAWALALDAVVADRTAAPPDRAAALENGTAAIALACTGLGFVGVGGGLIAAAVLLGDAP